MTDIPPTSIATILANASPQFAAMLNAVVNSGSRATMDSLSFGGIDVVVTARGHRAGVGMAYMIDAHFGPDVFVRSVFDRRGASSENTIVNVAQDDGVRDRFARRAQALTGLQLRGLTILPATLASLADWTVAAVREDDELGIVEAVILPPVTTR